MKNAARAPLTAAIAAPLLFAAGPVMAEERPAVHDQSVRDDLEALKRDLEAMKQRALDPDRAHAGMPWQIGAQYRIMANASNFVWHPIGIYDDEESRSFINQRFRTWASFSPTEQVGAYVQLEIGHLTWGDDRESPKDAEVELRRGYLQHVSEETGTFRIGIQDWHDAFGESASLGSFDAVDDYDSFGAVLANSIWDFNVGGLTWSQAFPQYRDLALNASAFVLWQGDSASADDVYLVAFDADLPIWDETGRVGVSLYYLQDNDHHSYPTAAPYDSAWDVWFGVRASKTFGIIPLRAWAIINTGTREEITGDDFKHTGWASKIEVHDLPLGPGSFSAQVVFASGEDDPGSDSSSEFRTIAQSERDNFGSQGYWSYMVLSSPHGPSDVNDLGVGLQNRGLGLITLQAKYGYPITDSFSGEVAAAWISAAADNPANGESDMGSEIAHTFTWKLDGGLALAFGGAYFSTGDFYTVPGGGEPDDLWEVFVRLQLEF